MESDNVTKALERLETMLAEREDEIETLKTKLTERDLQDGWGWCIHRQPKVDPNPDLPVPRLEIRFEPVLTGCADPWQAGQIMTYSLVYRHLLGHLVFVPIGYTKRSGGRGLKPDFSSAESALREMPFRDGAHIRNEMKQLNLPGFLICDDQAVPVTL